MKTLAFITLIITSSSYKDEAFITTQPLECIRDGNALAEGFSALGHEVDVYCDYTSAPVTSPRPINRPERIAQ